jgi:hypothetical protein
VSYTVTLGKRSRMGLLVTPTRSLREPHLPSPLAKPLRNCQPCTSAPLPCVHTTSLIALSANSPHVLHSPVLPLFLVGWSSSPFPLSRSPLRRIAAHGHAHLNPFILSLSFCRRGLTISPSTLDTTSLPFIVLDCVRLRYLRLSCVL